MVKVSIVVAVRNEEAHLAECLDSLLKQTLKDIEILVIDGLSDDTTPQIINKYINKNPKKIRSYSNKEQKVAQGRNIGYLKAKGKYIGFIDGHTYADTNWIKTLYEALKAADESVGGIGSVHFNADKKPFTTATTMVMSSFIGGGGTSYKPSKKLEQVQTAYACLYKREALWSIKKGEEFYNPYFVKGQDAEMNIRINKAGYKILRHPQAKTYYYKRPTLKAFWRQMVNAGFWRAKIMKHHPDTIIKTWTILTPLLFFKGIIILVLLGFVEPLLFLAGIGLFLIYLTVILLISTTHVIKTRKAYFFISSLLFLLLHIGYGFGLLKGIFKRDIKIRDRIKH